MLAFPKAAVPTLAVTYKCNAGHHNIRFWQLPTTIPSDVLCSACGWPSIIEERERQRHRQLRTELERWLV